MVSVARHECFWALMIAELRWQCGYQTLADFNNLWQFAQLSGTNKKYTRLDSRAHLELARILVSRCPSPAIYILLRNVLRHLNLQDEAERAYAEGANLYPQDPFLALRLADLYLATERLGQASEILGCR